MGLLQRIDEELKRAMKARDEATLSTLRLLKTAITYREIEAKSALDDDAILKVVQSLIKQRRDASVQFLQGGRPELAAKEDQEAAILAGYLPTPLAPEALSALVDEAAAEVKATSMKDMGAVMKAALDRVKGRAESRTVSELVKKRLSAK
jgi:uncharacterized protein YqeY